MHSGCLLLHRTALSHTLQDGLRIGSGFVSVYPDSLSWSIATWLEWQVVGVNCHVFDLLCKNGSFFLLNTLSAHGLMLLFFKLRCNRLTNTRRIKFWSLNKYNKDLNQAFLLVFHREIFFVAKNVHCLRKLFYCKILLPPWSRTNKLTKFQWPSWQKLQKGIISIKSFFYCSLAKHKFW